MRVALCVALWIVSSASHATGAVDPDFILMMRSCKIVGGNLTSPEHDLKVMDTVTHTLTCNRAGREVSCTLKFHDDADGHKGNQASYHVDFDSPPMLLLTDDSGADFFAIHTVNHTVAAVTRIVDAKYLASKVCQGLYATGDEAKLIPLPKHE